MSREIKFRAKGDDEETKNRWFYGSYYKTDDTTYCFKEDYDSHPDNTKHYILFDVMVDWCLPNRKLQASINPDTLGEFTGLKDKNGVEIYEGDIVKLYFTDIDGVSMGTENDIVYSVCGFWCIGTSEEREENLLEDYLKRDMRNEAFSLFLYDWLNECEVIGNIYENPELLEED